MTTMKCTRSMAVVAMAVMLALLPACGDDDDSVESEANETNGDPTAELEGEAVKLMVITAVGHTEADNPENFSAAEATAMAINRDGGVQGRPLEVLTCNDNLDPNDATECGRQAVDEGVVALVSAGSAHSDSFMPIVEEAGIPSVGNAQLGTRENLSELSWPISGGTVVLLQGAAKAVVDGGAQSVAIVHLDIAAAQTLVPRVESTIAAEGASVAATVPIPTTATDYATYVSRVLQSGADGAVLIMGGPSAEQFLVALSDAGESPASFTIGTTDTVFGAGALERLGPAAEGVFLAGSFRPASDVDDEGVAAYLREMDENGMTDPPNGYAFQAWASVHLVAELLEQADTVDSAGLLEQIRATGRVDRPATAPFDWSEPIEAYAPQRVFSTEVFLSRVEDGRPILITPEPVDVLAQD